MTQHDEGERLSIISVEAAILSIIERREVVPLNHRSTLLKILLHMVNASRKN